MTYTRRKELLIQDEAPAPRNDTDPQIRRVHEDVFKFHGRLTEWFPRLCTRSVSPWCKKLAAKAEVLWPGCFRDRYYRKWLSVECIGMRLGAIRYRCMWYLGYLSRIVAPSLSALRSFPHALVFLFSILQSHDTPSFTHCLCLHPIQVVDSTFV